MPKEWYQFKPNLVQETDSPETVALKTFNQRLVVDKKPYFFTYVYESLGREYKQYLTNANRKSLSQFNLSLNELLTKAEHHPLTEEEATFLSYYHQLIPVYSNPCVMNKICWRIEEEFKGWVGRQNKDIPFDYTILKSKQAYSMAAYRRVKDLYELYVKIIERANTSHKTFKKQSNEQHRLEMMKIRVNFKNEALKLCSNEEELCNMMLDFCYQNGKSKRFVWDVFGAQIIENLKQNNTTYSFPVRDDHGDIVFKGHRFTMIEKEVNECDLS